LDVRLTYLSDYVCGKYFNKINNNTPTTITTTAITTSQQQKTAEIVYTERLELAFEMTTTFNTTITIIELIYELTTVMIVTTSNIMFQYQHCWNSVCKVTLLYKAM